MPVSAAAQQQLSLSGLKPSDRSKAAELKAEIARLAGSQNGNDLAPERHAEIKQLLQQLEAMNPAQQVGEYAMSCCCDNMLRVTSQWWLLGPAHMRQHV